ncbi:MAG: S46 family peptidase, partial [Lachnospiraceae bacterium]|nr:S46 family peptidase [Lachnospiraceae bacterium]
MNSRDDHKKNPGQNISDQKKKDPDTTIDSHHYRELIEPAMAWYENHHRDLPWRQNQDPYRIWISEIMLQQGFQLSKEQLYQTDNAVMKAVVNFGGFCSGVVVSPDGLVFTNHHCGFDAIRQHSTVEHDY